MKIKQKKYKFSKKILIFTVGIIALIALLLTMYVLSRNGLFDQKNNETIQSVDISEDTAYSGPSETDTKESQEGKKKLETNKEAQTEIPQKTTPVGIAFADIINNKFEVRAFVSSVVEGGGTCTATLSKESTTLTQKSEAFIDASSSQCNPLYFSLSDIQIRGVWVLNVTYTSKTHAGESGPLEVSL